MGGSGACACSCRCCAADWRAPRVTSATGDDEMLPLLVVASWLEFGDGRLPETAASRLMMSLVRFGSVQLDGKDS